MGFWGLLSAFAISFADAAPRVHPRTLTGFRDSGTAPACRRYTPGMGKISYPEIYGQSRWTEGGHAFTPGLLQTSGAETKPGVVNGLMERELTPAIYDVLTSPKSKVYLGGYDPVGHGSKDGLEGTRVIWEREYTVAGKKRLALVVMAWRYDEKTKRLEFVDGPDSVRARAQVGDELSPPQFLSLSYSTGMKGKDVATVRPGHYVRKSKGEDYWAEDSDGRRAPLQARVTQCDHCHASGVRKNFSFGQWEDVNAMRADEHSPFSRMMADLPSDEARKNVEEQVRDLRANFLPPGLIGALKGRCNELAR